MSGTTPSLQGEGLINTPGSLACKPQIGLMQGPDGFWVHAPQSEIKLCSCLCFSLIKQYLLMLQMDVPFWDVNQQPTPTGRHHAANLLLVMGKVGVAGAFC